MVWSEWNLLQKKAESDFMFPVLNYSVLYVFEEDKSSFWILKDLFGVFFSMAFKKEGVVAMKAEIHPTLSCH